MPNGLQDDKKMSELQKFQEEIQESVEKLKNSVVTINATRLARHYRYGVAPVVGSGSGIIVDRNGYVVTNNHVLEGSENVEVVLPTGEALSGEVLGTDPATDIAIVRVERTDLPAATLADSDHVKPGQMALAIGNALGLPGGPTVSLGLVSAVGRPLPWADFIFEGLIQTDAAINPGNSGGPLANLSGEVIGINTAMIPFAQGVGFSIPVNTVKRIMSDILENGRVIRPWLGISGMELNGDLARAYRFRNEKGVLVVRISESSPAEQAGLLPGDVITAMGSKDIGGMRDMLEYLAGESIGESVEILFNRGSAAYRTRVRIEESPRLSALSRARRR